MNSRLLRSLALVVPIALAMVFVACGGDDDNGGGGAGSTGNVKTGSDAAYMRDICKAFATFEADLEKLTKDMATETDLAKVFAKMADPMETFAKNFAKANPPSDLKEWHVQASKALANTVSALKKGDSAAFEQMSESPFPDPPQAIQDRLEKVAASTKECSGLALFE